MEPSMFLRAIRLSSPVPEDSYLAQLPVVQALAKRKSLPIRKKVTFLVGENGSGKSTLLEAIALAYGFNAEGGTRNFSFVTKQTHSPLFQHLTIIKSAIPKDGFFLRAESFYNVASYIDTVNAQDSYGLKSLHHLSHGESFLALVQNRFHGNGIYLLDEPEAALSPMGLLALMGEIHNLVKENAQFIIATHSPMLMTFPDGEILQLSVKGIASVSYEETEHFQVTKNFLNCPQRMLHHLFQENDA